MRAPILNVVYNKYAFDVKNPTGAGIPKTPPPPGLPKPTALQPSAPLKLPPAPAPIPAGQRPPATSTPSPSTPTLSLAKPDNSAALQTPPLVSPPAGQPTTMPPAPDAAVKTTPTTASPTSTIVSGQSAPQQAPKPDASAQPADIGARLSDQNIPEADRRQMAQAHVQQLIDSQPELKQGLADLHAGKDTPAAKAFQAEVDKSGHNFIREEFSKRLADKPDASPQEQGGWLQDITQNYQNMPTEMKWMMGLGLGGGLIGILSSLFGNGGTGMGLLGLLGLGVGGLGAAAGGMFGQGAQSMVGDAAFNIGQFTGMIPEKADLGALMSDDPLSAAGNGPIGTRAQVGEQVAQQTQNLEQLKKLMSAPIPDEIKMQWMQKLDSRITSPEMAQKVFRNAQNMMQQYGDENSPLRQKLQQGQDYAGSTGLSGGFQEYVAVPLMNWWKGAEDNKMNIANLIEKWAENKSTPCSCGCGDTVKTCKCSADCSCRQPGGSCHKGEKQSASTPAWQRSAGKNDEGGLNAKGRASYNNATGGNLKAPVTESNPKGDRAKRQNSFCSRMCGMKKHETGSETKKDPDSRINKSLRKWNCKCAVAQATKWVATIPAIAVKADAAANISDVTAKIARCWAGYEPVPGAKKFSKGSCRPKGSKKTQKEMKKS